MKKLTIFILCVTAIIEFTSCAISETESAPRHYNLAFPENKSNGLKLFMHRPSGVYAEVVPNENTYSIDINRMQGGYSSFMGIKFNKRIPEEYKVLSIMKGDKKVKVFSIVDIESLKKNEAGNYLLSF